IARTVRWITRRLVLLLCRVAPRPVARCAGVLVIALVAVSAVDSLVVGNIFAVADRRAAVRNHGTDVDVVAPTSGLRSGGPSALITAVRDRWAALPPAARPRLLLFGESLGTLGTEETFGTVERMATGADGMLLEGPTFANPLHRQITEGRVPGTPVWDPGFR